jgi:hypothetical protein
MEPMKRNLSSHLPRIRKLHRWAAVPLMFFLLLHMLNHLVGVAGVDAHMAFMAKMRVVYRHPLIEIPLLLLVALQIITGISQLIRGWGRRPGFIARVQALSGGYLAFFLLNHVGAVLIGRTLFSLDTNFYFAAAGFHVPPFQYFFFPYYFLGVLALFVHSGCMLRIHSARPLVVATFAGIGFLAGALVVLPLAGVFYPVAIPDAYTLPYEIFAGGADD